MEQFRGELYRSGLRRQWRWRVRAANGKKVANGGESYHNFRECQQMFEQLFPNMTYDVAS